MVLQRSTPSNLSVISIEKIDEATAFVLDNSQRVEACSFGAPIRRQATDYVI